MLHNVFAEPALVGHAPTSGVRRACLTAWVSLAWATTGSSTSCKGAGAKWSAVGHTLPKMCPSRRTNTGRRRGTHRLCVPPRHDENTKSEHADP